MRKLVGVVCLFVLSLLFMAGGAQSAELVSKSTGGAQGLDHSMWASVSSDGRYVAFNSYSSNLIDGETHSGGVYVHDRSAGVTERLSDEGMYVDISGDGRFVTAVYPGVILYDRLTGRSTAVSSTTSQQAVISRDASAVAYIVDYDTAYIYYVATGERRYVAGGPGGMITDLSISADGRFVAVRSTHDGAHIAGSSGLMVDGHSESNDNFDIYLRDMQEGTIELISFAADGGAANNYSYFSSISADGRYVAFSSLASDMTVPFDTDTHIDVFLRDRLNGTTKKISTGLDGKGSDRNSERVNISADGRYIVFDGNASNLAPNDFNGQTFDVFVYDRLSNATEIVGYTGDGRGLNHHSYISPNHGISDDAGVIAFYSHATNILDNDVNAGHADVFVAEHISSAARCLGEPVVEITYASPLSIPSAKGARVDVTIAGVVSTPEGCEQSEATYTLSDEYGVYNTSDTLNLDVDGGFTLIATVEASRNGSDKDGRLYTIEIGASNELGAAALSLDAVVIHDKSGK